MDFQRRELLHVKQCIKEQVAKEKEAQKRIDATKILPMLISTVSELFKHKDEESGEILNAVVIKTSSRSHIFCPTSGMVPYD